MDQLSLPQVASVEQAFGLPHPVVHCPICGQKMFDKEEMDYTPCKHLVFVYMAVVNDYSYTSNEFASKIQSVAKDEQFWHAPLAEKLAAAGYGNNLLVLEITYGGMACGPVWYTDAYGFDYNSLME